MEQREHNVMGIVWKCLLYDLMVDLVKSLLAVFL